MVCREVVRTTYNFEGVYDITVNMSPKIAAYFQSERWTRLGYSSERYPDTAVTNRNRAQNLEEIKETMIQGIRKESLGRSDNRGTSTKRGTLSSTQVDGETMLIQA